MNDWIDNGVFIGIIALMHVVLGTQPTVAGLAAGAIVLLLIGAGIEVYKRYR